MSAGGGVALAAALVALLGAAVASAARTALSRMTLTRALRLVDDEVRGAARVERLAREPVRTQNILALLDLLLQVVGTALVTAVVAGLIDDRLAVVVATAVAAGLLFVLAEVAPRTLALQHTDRVATATAPFVLVARVPLGPVAGVLVRLGDFVAPGTRLPSGPFVTEEELREILDTAQSDDVIDPDERQMIHRIFELGDTVVREIMVPRPDMITVGEDDDLDRVLDVILGSGHSRIPVHTGDRERIVGVVHAKDVLARLHRGGTMQGPWRDLLRAPHFVPELANIDQVLRDMRARKVHLAIVVDEYGGTSGLVTIEDVLEEIVGEITDEYDTEQELVTELAADRWRVDARLPVDRLAELVDAVFPDEEWDSVGGLVSGVLGHVPAEGERVEVPPVRLTAETVRGHRVEMVLVERLTVADSTPAAAAS